MIQSHFIMALPMGFGLLSYQPSPGDTQEDFVVSQEANFTVKALSLPDTG